MRKQKAPSKGKGAEKVRAYLALTRPLNALMVLFAGILAGIIARAPVFCTFLASLGAAFISAGAQAINDYYDYEVDQKKGKRHRIKRKNILHFSMALYGVGIALAALASPRLLPLALLAAVGTLAYSAYLSRRKYWGNLVVAFFTGFIFVFVAICGDVTRVWFPFLLAFLATWAREVIKDIEDLPADRGHKTTLPMLVGTEMASYFAAYLLLLAVFFSPFPGPWGFGIFSVWYYYLLVPADLLFILSALYIIRGDPRRAQRLCKAGMLVALLAFAAGTIL
ncbi:MAG: geranylgeranylglycerol-phosphate geranylgeranyltransferase [Candidatus Diapherotrites archaeon]|nr:geranylgeranylglycerol-phosphate geranylgeranyltransferase [Candidatus Diapherotrites archaeon]MDN5366742.1 geranylgeranylglycerol-phosphate geranylgeranyltransferase [Candidatus Diapherotrites archaeon]